MLLRLEAKPARAPVVAAVCPPIAGAGAVAVVVRVTDVVATVVIAVVGPPAVLVTVTELAADDSLTG
jgi:hypothetical protein